jgi:hypothetical protein
MVLSTWAIDRETIAVNGREASFTGSFDSSIGKQAFVVLVITMSESGQDRWLVDALSIGPS